jgi:hypothetical protein
VKTALFFGAYLFLIVYAAHAQVGTGSIVTFRLAHNKFVIAADSRVILENGVPDDHECKIAAFKSKGVIFAATNGVRYVNKGINDPMPSWNAIDDARSVIAEGTKGRINAVDIIAANWESSMQKRWSQMLFYFPDTIRSLASKNNGGLTNAIFAGARGRSIDLVMTSLVLNNNSVKVERHIQNCTAAPCASGETDVFNKYMSSGKEFMAASPKLIASVGYELLRVIKLVDLSVAEDKTGTIHGPVDAVELSNNGTIRWHQKKCNCPENSD